MVAFLVTLLVAIALAVISYAITPRPKAPKPEAAKQLEDPVAEAGIERPVPFGTLMVTQLNVLWFGDKGMREYTVKA